MTKIKVSSLQPGPQMDALVAMAANKAWSYGNQNTRASGDVIVGGVIYNPSGNGGQCFDAAKEYEIDLFIRQAWTTAMLWLDDDTAVKQYGETPEIAICKAVIAAHFGDEVEVEE